MMNKKPYEGQYAKYKDNALAEKIWPLYQGNGGSARRTFEKFHKEKIDISRPTLNKLIDHFGFVGKLKKYRKAQVNKSVAAHSENKLQDLLDEVTEQKNAVHQMIVDSPADMEAHKLYGDYIGQIIVIKKQILATRQVNKDQLIGDVLTGVVGVLLEQGQKLAAEVVTQNLENFTNRVKEKWQQQT